MILADATTGGYIAGNIVAIVLGVICALCMIGGVVYAHGDGYTNGGYGFSFIAFLCGLVVAGAWLWSTWPLQYEYHHWIDKQVVVTDTSSRLLTDSDGNIQQKFVVSDSKGSYYAINDTRGSLVKEDQTVNLRCKRAYDYGVPRSSHGWDCKWNGKTG